MTRSVKITKQLDAWASDFGKAYTDRNPLSAEDMDKFMEDYCGAKSSVLFRDCFPPAVVPSGRALEVGCNVGAQLRILKQVNPGLELYGIEPMPYALKRAREADPTISFLPGTAFDLPFKDGYFDVIMTNTVLIHIAPSDLVQAMKEIYRCSKRFIFGHEYFAESPVEVSYRGAQGLLWKTNFLQRYRDLWPDLHPVYERYLKYADPDRPGQELVDQVFLLEKASR